jgi:hypothetical protein|tara:strand:- start:3725 stop:10429 length:6705 start_codon:yes stop_codon:yes gene_type:complete
MAKDDQKEKDRIAAIHNQTNKLAEGRYLGGMTEPIEVNPNFGTDPLDPDSYVPYQFVNPELSQPIPQSTPYNPNAPTGASMLRASQIEEFVQDPKKYMDENAPELNQEQSLIDKGLSLWGRLNDYTDESDLEIFGINLSAVESTFDQAVAVLDGSMDAFNAAKTALVSAMPGGMRTLEWGELTDELSFQDLMNGKLDEGEVPSFGQVMVASMAMEAKRIREGGARLSDILLMNPVTGPPMLAALAAESSPLQQDDFDANVDMFDDARREEIFSTGWEKTFSTVADVGNAFMDPFILGGIGTKVIRLGKLGNPGTAAYNRNFDKEVPHVQREFDELGGETDSINIESLAARGRQVETEIDDLTLAPTKQMADGVTEATPVVRAADDISLEEFNRVTLFDVDNMPVELVKKYKENQNVLVRQIFEIFEYKPRVKGDPAKSRISALQLSKNLSVKDNPNADQWARLMLTAKNPQEALLYLRGMNGSKGALEKIRQVSAGKADAISSYRTAYYRKVFGNAQPQKVAIVAAGLNRQMQTLRSQIKNNDEAIREIEAQNLQKVESSGTVTDPSGSPDFRPSSDNVPDVESLPVENLAATKRQQAVLQRRKDQTETLQKQMNDLDARLREVVDGDSIDLMNPSSPNYNPMEADRIVEDLLNDALNGVGRQDPTDILELQQLGKLNMQGDVFFNNLEDTFSVMDSNLLIKNNWYSKRVASSRSRRAKAAFEYSQEGTSIVPKRRITAAQTLGTAEGAKAGQALIEKSTDFWSSSKFIGTNTFERNMRAWRWIGEKTPAGYVGLTARNINGVNDEFNAALDTPLYKGKATTVDRQMYEADGQTLRYAEDGSPLMETITVGGSERKAKFIEQLVTAIMDDKQDAPLVFANIQKMIYDDMGAAYGLSPYNSDKLAIIGKNKSDTAMKQVEEHNYFVDPKSNGTPGDIQVVAFLESSFQNGSYMHNFREFEKVLKRNTGSDFGARLNATLDGGLEIGSSVYNVFNNVWRPITLFRMGYTQRNVLEGVFRSMAHGASLAPLLWPVTGTYQGVRNIAASKSANKGVKKARGRVQGTEYQKMSSEMNQDIIDLTRLKTSGAYNSQTDRIVVLKGGGRPERSFSKNEIDEEIFTLENRIARNKVILEGNVSEYDAALKGTKFGTWRQKNIADLEQNIVANNNVIKQLKDTNADQKTLYIGNEAPGDDMALLENMAELRKANVMIDQELRDLKYNISKGTEMYRSIAGRKIRIGSGQSMGPDGNFYNDAFAGPYDQINRGAMSSDNTVMQSLSMRSGPDNVFRNIQRKRNVVIEANKTTLRKKSTANPRGGTYANAISEAIETSSSSVFVQALWRNNFNAKLALNDLMNDDVYKDRLILSMSMMEDGDDLAKIAEVAKRVMQSKDATPDAKKSAKRASEWTDEQIRQLTESSYTISGGNVGAMDLADLIDPVSGTLLPGKRGKVKRFLTQDNATGRVEVFDVDTAERFLMETAEMIQDQMQGNPKFLEVLGRRIDAKSRKTGQEFASTVKATVSRKSIASRPDLANEDTGKTIQNIIDSMDLSETDSLGRIVGDELLDLGSNSITQQYASLVRKMFHVLSTIPEDAIVRGPFYNGRYKASRNAMIESYLRRTDQFTGKKSRIKTKAGAEIQGTLSHGKTKIPVKEMARIEAQSHALALKETRKWMYTIERRTKLGKYGEWLVPFISASQNSATVAGKLLYRDPALAPAIAQIWNAPQILQIEDENGNIIIPQPPSVIKDFLKDNPDIPVFGGVFGENDVMTVSKNGFNLMMPETGYGVVPRPGPLVGISASEIMKKEMFGIGVERPDILASFMGDGPATAAWSEMKKYIYGEYGGVSKQNASWDKMMPTVISKIYSSKKEMSDKYAKYYANFEATERMRYYYNDREDMPSTDELNKRATNALLFEAVGNFGAPNPLTPMPIITRPMINTPLMTIQNRYRKEMEHNPDTATQNMTNLFGDWALNGVNQKVTRNIGGANPVSTTVSDINTLDPLIRQISPYINEANLGVLGILVNNRIPYETEDSDYEKSAYEILKSKKIAGRDDNWRSVQTGEMALADRQRSAGWKKYTDFMGQLDAQVAAAGLSSIQVNAAEPFRQKKKAFIQNMKSNPEMRGWTASYGAGARNRISESIKVIEAGINDSGFQKLMMDSGKERTYGIMVEYIEGRNAIMNVLKESGKSIDNEVNYHWKVTWDAARTKWRNSDVRWAEIDTLYLSGDNNPEFYGTNFTDGDM